MAHIKDVVYQTQQVLARDPDLIQVTPQGLRVIKVLLSQVIKPDDCVERRADVVAHVREKHRLGLVCLLGRVQGFFQNLLALALLRDRRINVLEAGDNTLVVLGFEVFELVVVGLAVVQHAIRAHVFWHLPKILHNGLRFHGIAHGSPIVRVHALLDISLTGLCVRVGKGVALPQASGHKTIELKDIDAVIFWVDEKDVEIIPGQSVEEGLLAVALLLIALATLDFLRDIHAIENAFKVVVHGVLDNARRHAGPSHITVIEVRLYFSANLNTTFLISLYQGFPVKYRLGCLTGFFIGNKREDLPQGLVDLNARLDALEVVGGRAVYRDAAILGKVKVHDALSLGNRV